MVGQSLSLAKLIPWLGAVIVAIGGGTFGITKYSAEQHISALNQQIIFLKENRTILKDTVFLSKQDRGPVATLIASTDPKETSLLIDRIRNLEAEKTALVNQLSNQTLSAIDPKSELAPLLKQLSDSIKEKRLDALKGLFALADSNTVPILISYYFRYPVEATSMFETNIYDWFNLLWSLDHIRSIDFILDIFCSNDENLSVCAYNYLFNFKNAKNISFISNRVKSSALTNSNSLIRARAKLLLRNYKLIGKPNYRPPDNRSILDIVLDIDN
jgi:hypothetical protein